MKPSEAGISLKSKTESVRSFYDDDSKRYLDDRYEGKACEHFSYRSRTAIALEMLRGSSGRTLDVGCGPAIYTRALVDMGHRPVSADLSYEMLRQARSIAGPLPGAAWANSEVEKLPFRDASFDNVLAIGVLAYASDTLAALTELARVLKPGGTLITQCSNTLAPTPWLVKLKDKALQGLGLRPKPAYGFQLTTHPRSAFLELLRRAGLEPLEARSYDFRLPFLEKFLPGVALSLMEKGHAALSNSQTLHWLGEGYMVKVRKTGGVR